MPESQINTFEGGINKDVSETNIKPNQYLHCRNGIIIEKDGNTFNLINELGTIPVIDFPEGYLVIGSCYVNTKIVFFLVNPTTGCSEIGYILPNENTATPELTYTYTTVLNDCSCNCSPSNPEWQNTGKNYKALNFKITHQIDAESRIDFKGDDIVYFTETYDDTLPPNNPPRYINLNTSCCDYTDLTEDLKLFPSFDSPIITYVNQVVGGSLKVGSYFFTARYLTDDLDPLGFGFVTNTIPVVDDISKFASRFNYDGANYDAPRTAKSIVLNIKNLDSQYKYLEIAVIYYDGAESSPKAKIFQRITYSGSSTQVIFNGIFTDAAQDIDITSIANFPIAYRSAKHIIQKDGRLFLSNLTSSEIPNLQDIANNIVVRYIIEELPADDTPTNYEDYKEEYNTYQLKGYRREEVYSLGIGFVFKDGTTSQIYHIPGNDLTTPNPSTTQALVVPGVGTLLDTYISTDNYDTNLNIPGLAGNNIRHHRIPNLQKEPHFRNTNPTDPDNGNVVIRVLGLQFLSRTSGGLLSTAIQEILTTNPALDKFFKAEIKGYFLVREPRDTPQKKSIISQGIIQDPVFFTRAMPTDVLFPFNPYVPQANRPISPLVGDTYDSYKINVPYNRTYHDTGYPISGAEEFYTSLGYVTSDVSLCQSGSSADLIRYPSFYFSPETTLYLDFRVPVGSKIKPVTIIAGKKVDVSDDDDNEPPIWIRRLYYTFYNHNIDPDVSNVSGFNLTINQLEVPFENNINPQSLNYNLSNLANYFKYNHGLSEQFNILYLINAFGTPSFFEHPEKSTGTGTYVAPYPAINDNIGTHTYQDSLSLAQSGTLNVSGGFSSNLVPEEFAHSTHDKRFLFNVYRELQNQYGQLGSASYILITPIIPYTEIPRYEDPNASSYPQVLGNPVNRKQGVFNGDTFISKFGVKVSSSFRVSKNIFTYLDVSAFSDPQPAEEPGHVRALFYIFVESDINCDYRHRPIEYDDKGNAILFGVDYYPHEQNKTVVLKQDPSLGDSTGYNVQYSLEPTVKKYFNALFGSVNINKFPTRTIYSQASLEGEQSDQNRIFLSNNYNDLPKDTGEITNQFIHNGTLYLHTVDALWRTYVNEQTAIPSNNNEIFLGSGGLFNPIVRKIITLDGGHAGSVSKWATINTQYGVIFVDMIRKQIFLFNEDLKEITEGMNSFFMKNLFIPNHNNNPANPSIHHANINANGIIGVYDDRFKRYILTVIKNSQEESSNFTFSFSFLSKSWTSEHDYKPRFYKGGKNKVFAVTNNLNPNNPNSYIQNKNRLWLHNEGKFGILYDNYYYDLNNSNLLELSSLLIKFVVNKYPDTQKVFDNIKIFNESVFEEINQVLRDTYNTIIVFNRHCNTGVIDLVFSDIDDIGDDTVDYTSEHYQHSIEKNRVINPNIDVLNPSNLYPIDTDFLPRIKGKYAIVELIYKNLSNYKIVTNSIETIIRPVVR